MKKEKLKCIFEVLNKFQTFCIICHKIYFSLKSYQIEILFKLENDYDVHMWQFGVSVRAKVKSAFLFNLRNIIALYLSTGIIILVMSEGYK